VRLGVLTKPERGYHLLGPKLTCHRAETLELEKGLDVSGAFARVAQDCIRHYRLNEAIVLERRSAEAVHQARVALRRLRSGLLLFRKLLPQPETRQFQVRLRDLAAIFGEVRDLDVLRARPDRASRRSGSPQRMTPPRRGSMPPWPARTRGC